MSDYIKKLKSLGFVLRPRTMIPDYVLGKQISGMYPFRYIVRLTKFNGMLVEDHAFYVYGFRLLDSQPEIDDLIKAYLGVYNVKSE